MKSLVYLILLVSFSIQLNAQQISFLARERLATVLKGKPSKITTYYSVHSEAKPASTSKNETVFDTLGRVLHSTTYGSNGKVNHRREYVYDSVHKRMLATISFYNHKEESFSDTTFNHYDAKGFLIRQVYKYKDSSSVTELTNDENGFPVSAISYNNKGQVSCIESAKYDLKKNIFTVRVQYKPVSKLRKNVYKLDFTKPSVYDFRKNEKYNEQGNCLSYESVGSNGKTVEHTTEYVYDQNGNWISSVQYRMYPVSIGGKQMKVTESRNSRQIEYFE